MSSVAEWWKNETFIPLEWSPPATGRVVSGRPPRRRRVLMPALAVVALGALVLGWLAWHESRSADHWRTVAHQQMLRSGQAESRLAQVESRLADTQSRLSQTDGRLSDTQSRLSMAQSELAQAEAQLNVVHDQAGQLQDCLDASRRAATDFFGFFTGAERKAAAACAAAGQAQNSRG